MGNSGHTVDRTGWESGPWDDEPEDWWQGVDVPTGLVVFAVRSWFSGAWNAYACLPIGHPARRWPMARLEDLVVHGGVTYVAGADPDLGPRVEDPPARVLLVGFDCNHGWDLAPGLNARMRDVGLPKVRWVRGNTYRTLDFVKAQLDDLCQQLGPSAPLEAGEP